MEFTKVQLRTLINNHFRRDGDLNDVMEWIQNSLMRHERILALLRKHLEKRHTITNDNGGEFAQHKRTGKTLKLGIYFADMQDVMPLPQ